MKISHLEYASIFLIIGILSSILYVVVGIYEVNNSNRISSSKKVLWIIGFILFSFIVGLFYLISARKKNCSINGKYKLNNFRNSKLTLENINKDSYSKTSRIC
jgi:uncharacterized membrane protein YciS (DUF1049 family)